MLLNLNKKESKRMNIKSLCLEQQSKLIYPGDWMRFHDAADFKAFGSGELPLPEVCSGLSDSASASELLLVHDNLNCGHPLADARYWYYHKTRHIARCHDCQEAEWLCDGYDVDEFGQPSCWDHRHTREERIAERARNALQQSERWLAHQLDTPKGRAWLATPEGQKWRSETEPWVARRLAELDKVLNPHPVGKLLDKITAILRRYVMFPIPEQPMVIALWVVHTWLIEAFDYTPYLFVFAAAKRSGKSRVLELLELLCRNPEMTQSGSSAALLRSIDEKNPPTFLIDEVDVVFSKKNDTEGENMRGFLNAGFKRGSKFMRCVGQGAAMEPKKFSAFCPKAFAGIGRCLPDTVLDRSIPIELERQSHEKKAERFREREVRPLVEPIRAELEALAKQPGLIETLRAARPVLPGQLNDRAQDITEPLFAIADLAGGKWTEEARRAIVRLYGQQEDEDLGVKLLNDIKRVFDEQQTDRLGTIELIKGLVASADGPWPAMFEDLLRHEKHQTAASRLTKLLRDYRRSDGERLRPRKIRVDDETVQGFYREDFQRAWERHLDSPVVVPHSSGTSGTPEQMASSTWENSVFHSEKAKWNASGTVDCPRENAKCSTVPAVPLTPLN